MIKKDVAIEIRYNSYYSNSTVLSDCEHELNSNNIKLYKSDLKDIILHSASDFVDYDFIIISFMLMQNILFSASYDLIKSFILKLWNGIRPNNEGRIPFTIKINRIPTKNGSKNISCKVQGKLTQVQKGKIIDEFFNLANRALDNSEPLLKDSKYHDLFNGHVFSIDPETLRITEIDIEREIQKRIDQDT